MIPSTVATSAEQIRKDLKVFEFDLAAEEAITIKVMASG